MTRPQRIFTYIAASVGVLVLGWVVLIAGIYFYGGVATVSVVERSEGVNISLPIPMALVHAAAATTEVFFLDEILDEVEVEMGGHFEQLEAFGPSILAVLEILEDVPNGTTFVSVQDGEEHVLVSKVRGKFRIEVESPDLSVKVSVPTRSVKRTVAQIVR